MGLLVTGVIFWVCAVLPAPHTIPSGAALGGRHLLLPLTCHTECTGALLSPSVDRPDITLLTSLLVSVWEPLTF